MEDHKAEESDVSPTLRPDIDRLLSAARSAHDPPTLQALARDAHLSHFHLSRLLKAHLGYPLRDFLAAMRVDRGIDALIDNQSVIDSQVRSGHESASSYHRAFRKHTGLAPSTYRAHMASLASRLIRHQDDADPLIVFHREYPPGENLQPHGLTLRIAGRAPKSALFVALHPAPLLAGNPFLGIALLGTDQYTIADIPDGRYFAMVVEVPRTGGLRAYFHMGANRRQLERRPITFPLAEPRQLTLTLRPPVASDPPITPNLPRLFVEGLTGRLDFEVRNSGQPPPLRSH